jgi:hypothetical protein
MAGQLLIEDLLGRIDSDSTFATALETDAFAALENAGFDEWARAVEQERDRVSGLVDRIYVDEQFRQAVEADPTRALGEWGLPEDAVEPLLALVGAPDDVLERATADVEAHLGRKPATVAALTAMLGALAFAQQASASSPAAKAQVSFHPGSKAQIAHTQIARPGARAEVSRPGAKAEVARPGARAEIVNAVAKAQVSKPGARAEIAHGMWHGVAAKTDAKLQTHILSILRAQSSLSR